MSQDIGDTRTCIAGPGVVHDNSDQMSFG
jgi:hypothetical protein